MKKRTLSLDKEVLSSSDAPASPSGATTLVCSIVATIIYTIITRKLPDTGEGSDHCGGSIADCGSEPQNCSACCQSEPSCV